MGRVGGVVECNQRLKDAFLDDFRRLVDQFSFPDDLSGPAARIPFFNAGRFDKNGVTKKKRTTEDPVADRGEGNRANVGGVTAKPCHPRHPKQTMSNRLPVRRFRSEIVVNMQWVEIACHRRKIDDVSFRHRSAGTDPDLSDLNVIKK